MSDLRKKYTDMKVAELRTELDKLGLEKHGVKMVLVERLLKHFETSAEESDVAIPVVASANGEGDNADAEEISSEMETEAHDVVVDEDIDATNEDIDAANEEQSEEGVDVEVGEEDEEQFDEEQVDNEEYDEVYVEDGNEEGTAVIGEENGDGEEEGEGDHEVCYENGDEADTDADTLVVGETVDDEDNDGDGDALNISVEEGEVLAIDTDDKMDEDIHDTEDVVETTAEGSQDDDQDESNNTSTTGKNEADADSKAAEGESEETSTGKETERHIILVTGLSSDTSANDLKTFFRKYGKIGRIKIMTNTRVPGSQRFAHISVPSLDELKYLVDKLNGIQLKGKSIRVAKAPEDGSVSRSYEIAVATARAEADDTETSAKDDSGKTSKSNGNSAGTTENGKDNDGKDDAQVVKDSGKDAGKKEGDNAKKSEPEKKKDDKKEPESTEKKSPEKGARPDRGATAAAGGGAAANRSRKESHDRPPRGDHVRPHRPPPFRRDKDSTEWKRHGPPRGQMEITRVHRDRPPMGRGLPPNQGGRRRSPHAAQLTFEQIREIRDEQRRREHERRKREEERERAAEVDRQKRLEYQNYMEFKQLEREREKLRLERERIEREKQELIKLERERQKAEREKIEREKEELRRAKLNIDHQRSVPVKRPYEDDKLRRRESDERKKPYVVERNSRPDGKTEAERKMERERYERDRLHAGHSAEGRSRSPFRSSGARESRRDIWARDERDRSGGRVRTRSDERSHRRETEAEKAAAVERRNREAPSRGVGSSVDLLSRHAIDTSHSSSRGAEITKRPSDRYEEPRTTSGREAEWIQRSSYLPPTSSLSLPMSASTSAGRESWPFAERKIEAWDTSRLAPRTEQWISGAGATVGTTGRSSMPVIAPPPPMYSSAAASLALQGSGLGLGGYSSERYDGYRGGFHPLRKY